MYPQKELDRLAARKALLQARISVRRVQCGHYAARLAEPVHTLDRALAKWRQVSPWVKLIGIPTGIIMGRRVLGRRQGKFTSILKFVPIAFHAARLITQSRANAKARLEFEPHAY